MSEYVFKKSIGGNEHLSVTFQHNSTIDGNTTHVEFKVLRDGVEIQPHLSGFKDELKQIQSTVLSELSENFGYPTGANQIGVGMGEGVMFTLTTKINRHIMNNDEALKTLMKKQGFQNISQFPVQTPAPVITSPKKVPRLAVEQVGADVTDWL
jgi:hypothetical protein